MRLLNFVKAGTPQKKQLIAQARALLDAGLWGVPTKSPATHQLKPGDRVIAYVGAPERVFIGDALIDGSYHTWTADEAARYPISATFEAGVSLRDVSIWGRPVPLMAIWPTLVASKKHPTAFFMQTTHALLEADGARLLQAGRNAATDSQAEPASEGPPAPAPEPPRVGERRPSPAPRPSSTPADTGRPSDQQAASFFAVVEELRQLDPGLKLNEETTRAVFLNKYFETLGYSSLHDITYGESAVSGRFPDYVLKIKGHAAVAVEAKALGAKLGDKEAGQITGYCGTLGVRWGLLTDGRYFKLYDAHILKASMDDRLVFELDLADYRSAEDFEITIWTMVQMLSKAAMRTGEELDRYAARELSRRMLTDTTSPVLAVLQTELVKQKVHLTLDEVRSILVELLSS